MSTNRISLNISESQKTAVETAANALKTATEPFKIVIEKEELKSLQTIADGRLPFVEKAVDYAVLNPEFLPPHADVPEFQQDLKTFKDIREMVRPLRQILDNLENTMYVTGSEAFDAARDYYKTVKFHAQMGTPGAQTIYDDLRHLFELKSTPEPEA